MVLKDKDKNCKILSPLTNSSSGYALAVSYVVAELMAAYDQGLQCNFTKLKGDAAKKFKIEGLPKAVDILSAIPSTSVSGVDYKTNLRPFLLQKPVRTASGVAIVAVMSKPHRCPHIAFTGNVCVYCPGGPDSDFEYSTQAVS